MNHHHNWERLRTYYEGPAGGRRMMCVVDRCTICGLHHTTRQQVKLRAK